ncbi:TATA-box binding [Thermoactinomyces sp. DSM 45891]|uniref:YwmB family TATA-box binding protein n=1 Tax=Thermoactinomyces sp. DSM 45891 TaxID=1761907 RepID=UPI0009206D54|nr:YwmB family TATA-box binding protein [Thermoactinomyces sp. DSM 45891]SFX23868.1 TATA-box binding [Thermoactinomyces sp. DSM 45891]
MKAKWGVFLVWIVLCVLLMGNTQAQTDLIREILDHYQTTRSTPSLFVLHHGSRTNQLLTGQQVEELAKRLNGEFHGTNLQTYKGKDGVRYQSDYLLSPSLKIAIRVIDDKPTEIKKKPYVSLQLRGTGAPDARLYEFQKQFQQICQTLGMTPSLHFSIQGDVDLKQASELKSLIQSTMKPLGATQIEEMTTEKTVSISYFIPRWGSGIVTQGGEMNLQVSARWNYQTNRAVLTMGTPIITIEY